LNFTIILDALSASRRLRAATGFAGPAEGAGVINVSAVARGGFQRPPAQPIKHATVLGPIKAKPFGWPGRRGQP